MGIKLNRSFFEVANKTRPVYKSICDSRSAALEGRWLLVTTWGVGYADMGLPEGQKDCRGGFQEVWIMQENR